MSKILLVGGAGYIGSHVAAACEQRGLDYIVLDNLSTGSPESIVNFDKFVRGDICDHRMLNDLFSRFKFTTVMHFACLSNAAESINHPLDYYESGLMNSMILLKAMLKAGITEFIFSSSAAVYGAGSGHNFAETDFPDPINPYGASKMMLETIIRDFETSYGLRTCVFRYFNVAGADNSSQLGERHEPETHLIPLVLKAALDKSKVLKVFGNSFGTSDGTAIRDYIHVLDISEAHLLGLNWIRAGNSGRCFNLGRGVGVSVNEVINLVQEITGIDITVKYHKRRKGEPSRLVADISAAQKWLGWSPQYDLEEIISSAWRFECDKNEENSNSSIRRD